MEFSWKEYLDVARLLLDKEREAGPEAKQRAAVSRAYYAAFGHTLKHVMDFKNFQPSGRASDHSSLRRFCKNHGMVNIGRHLNDLCDWRDRCDYDSEVPGLTDIVPEAMKLAELVVSSLR